MFIYLLAFILFNAQGFSDVLKGTAKSEVDSFQDLTFHRKEHEEILGHLQKERKKMNLDLISTPLSLYNMRPAQSKLTKSFKSSGTLVASGEKGNLYTVGERKDGFELKSFDRIGNVQLVTNIRNAVPAALSCLTLGGSDLLIMLIDKHIEMRDGTTGRLLDSLECIGGFEPHSLCKAASDSFLVCNWVGSNSKIIEYKIKDGKLAQGQKEMQIPLSYITGLSTIILKERNQVVVVALSDIMAVDYDSGKYTWQIKKAKFDKKRIGPWDVCSDGAEHLYVADYQNKRVVVLNNEGKILSKIVNTDNLCYHLTWMECDRKLVVTDSENMVNIYAIRYEH